MSDAISKRYDFIYLFDVKDGNPNGDPDAGNLPRIDPDTGNGLITDVCLKRKIRNFVALTMSEKPGYDIYVKERAVLNQQHQRAYKALDLDPKKKNQDAVEKTRVWMCQNFYDVRTFGAVMTTGVNCGQVRGPVQFSFARSVDRIAPAEHSITRMAVTTEREAEDQDGGNRTMGRKATVPYGLYAGHGFISASLAMQTNFSEDDLALLWKALQQMFEHDRSASRGLMSAQKLFVFEHDSALGSAPAGKLFDLIKIELKDPAKPPRKFADYDITIDKAGLPNGVELIEKL